MAKMLMGQIDHARGRITTITKQKLGPAPKPPVIEEAKGTMAEIRQGKIVPTPAQLKLALSNYVNRVPIPIVDSEGGSWDYQTRTHSSRRYFVGEEVRDTLGACLTDVINGKRDTAAVAIWAAANEKYENDKARLTAEAVAVEDAIVLGDQAAALAALTAFAAFEL